MKQAINVTVDRDLIKWVDVQVKERRFASRSHAVNVGLAEMRKREAVRF